MLHIKEASICFGERPLFSELTINLHSGEMACIQGSSGKGKTSLLNAIMGFVPLSSGSITVNDIILHKDTVDSIRKYIAWIPQELSLPSERRSEERRVGKEC